MQKQTELRLEPWTVIVAIALVALVAFLFLRLGGMGSMGMNPQAMMTQAMNGIDRTLEQSDMALTHANEALKAADLAGVQKHVQLAQDALVAQGGALAQLKMMQAMMQGPMMALAQQGMMSMSLGQHDKMMTALQAAQSSLEGALEHFGEALTADKLETAQEHARLASEQLQAAQGSAGSTDPKAGALTYAKALMAQMMGSIR